MATGASNSPIEDCFKELRDDHQPPSDKENGPNEPESDQQHSSKETEGGRPLSSSEGESFKNSRDVLKAEISAGKSRKRDTFKEWLPGSFEHKMKVVRSFDLNYIFPPLLIPDKGLIAKDGDNLAADNAAAFESGSVQHTTIKRSASERLSSITERGMEKARKVSRRLTTGRKYADPLEQWMYDHSGGTVSEHKRPYSL